MTDAFVGAPRDLTTTTHLKAKFQIGGTTAKKLFRPAEKVFHSTDMPQHAKDARRQVLAKLNASTMQRAGEFNISTTSGPFHNGKMRTPWGVVVSKQSQLEMERNIAESRENISTKRRSRVTGPELHRPVDFAFPFLPAAGNNIYSSGLAYVMYIHC